MYTAIYIILLLVYFSASAKVTWVPNINFNLPINFKDGKTPCSKQNVVFPETLMGFVDLQSGISVGSLILPMDGELVISDGVIELGDGNDNCTEAGNVYFLEKSVSSWAQPDVWSSPRFNEATPDAERVPCFDDVVEFPANSVFTITLPEKTQIVREMKIGDISYDTNSLSNFVTAQQTQQFILNENLDIGVNVVYKQCNSRSGCPCQERTLNIDCSSKFCSVPTCVDPIQPIGHCCKICGGVSSFDIDQSFDLMKFNEFVDKIVESYHKKKLVVHTGRIKNRIQLIVVEKGQYSGISAEVVNYIDRRMPRQWVQGLKETIISGSPMYKYGLGGKIFISMFFAVIFVIGGIFLYYYKLPQFRYPVIGGSNLFSRYQRRSDSVVSLTRRDSIISSITRSSSAFRNPLYDSKRGRVVVEETSNDQ